MKDLTPLLNLLAFYMKHRRTFERREARNPFGDHDAYLAAHALTERIHYLVSFIRSLS
jgi:hypothetical protein